MSHTLVRDLDIFQLGLVYGAVSLVIEISTSDDVCADTLEEVGALLLRTCAVSRPSPA